MTKKEVIIDGIDVSKCNLFCPTYKSCTACLDLTYWYYNIGNVKVKNNGKCFYYNGVNFLCENNPNCNYKQLQRRISECDELKAQLETYSKMLEDPEFKIALIDVRTGERDVWRKLGNKAQKYEQALNKIKDIVSGNYEMLDPLAKQQIKNVISEVKKDIK